MKELAKLIAKRIKEEETEKSRYYRQADQETNELQKEKTKAYAFACYMVTEELKKILVEVATKINIEE